jgi:hypothetical protein
MNGKKFEYRNIDIPAEQAIKTIKASIGIKKSWSK